MILLHLINFGLCVFFFIYLQVFFFSSDLFSDSLVIVVVNCLATRLFFSCVHVWFFFVVVVVDF